MPSTACSQVLSGENIELYWKVIRFKKSTKPVLAAFDTSPRNSENRLEPVAELTRVPCTHAPICRLARGGTRQSSVHARADLPLHLTEAGEYPP